MIENRSKEIDGITYVVSQIPARRANKLQRKLAAIIAPAATMFAERYADSPSRAVSFLVEKMDETTFEHIRNELSQVSTADGIPLADGQQFDAHFTGKLATQLQWMAFALEVQFGNFTDALSGAIEKAMTSGMLDPILKKLGLQPQSQSPSTSETSGQSGASSEANTPSSTSSNPSTASTT